MRFLLLCLVLTAVPVAADGGALLENAPFSEPALLSAVESPDFAPAVFAPGADTGGAGASMVSCPGWPYYVCGATCGGTVIGCECVAGSEFSVCDVRSCPISSSC